jgi:hypothetical protein
LIAPAERARDLQSAQRRVRVGDERVGELAVGDRERAERQPRGGAVVLARRPHHGSDAVGQLHPRVAGGELDLRGVGGRVRDQQPRQRRAPAVGLPRGRRLLPGVALRRCRGQLVDVGEDRLGQQRQRVAVELQLAGTRRRLSPRHARADPVGREQRLEAAALARLAATELGVELALGQGPLVPALDDVEELRQRALDAGANALRDRALERPRVGRDGGPDRHDHLLRERLEPGSHGGCDERGKLLPWPLRQHAEHVIRPAG